MRGVSGTLEVGDGIELQLWGMDLEGSSCLGLLYLSLLFGVELVGRDRKEGWCRCR